MYKQTDTSLAAGESLVLQVGQESRSRRFGRFIAQVYGTFTGATAVIEGSLDGTNYAPVASLNAKTNAWNTGTSFSLSNSTSALFKADCDEYNYMRLKVVACSTGAVSAVVGAVDSDGPLQITGVSSDFSEAVVTLTSAQLLALDVTPITVISAPGANLAILVDSVELRHAGGTAYAAIAGGDDLFLKYTDGSGAQCFTTIETTGLLDQTSAQARHYPANTASAYTPVANAVVVASLGGAITTGNFDLIMRIRYRTVSTNFS